MTFNPSPTPVPRKGNALVSKTATNVQAASVTGSSNLNQVLNSLEAIKVEVSLESIKLRIVQLQQQLHAMNKSGGDYGDCDSD